MAVRRILPLGQPSPSYLDFPIAISDVYVANSTNNDSDYAEYISVAVPTPNEAGDLMIIFGQMDNGDTYNIAFHSNTYSPSFTELFHAQQVNPDGQASAVAWKRLTEPEDGVYGISHNRVGTPEDLGVVVLLVKGAASDAIPNVTCRIETSSLPSPVQANVTHMDVNTGDLLLWGIAVDELQSKSSGHITAPTGFTVNNEAGWMDDSPHVNFLNMAIASNTSPLTGNTSDWLGEGSFTLSSSTAGYAGYLVSIAPSKESTYTSGNSYYTYNYSDSRTAWEAYHPSISRTHSIGFGIEGGGSAITVGTKGTIEVPYDFTIGGWTMIADQSGSANVDLWSRDYSTTLPTQANSVTDNIGMTISTATANQSTTISNWRMDKINAGNVVTYNVQSCSTITRLMVNLFGTKG